MLYIRIKGCVREKLEDNQREFRRSRRDWIRSSHFVYYFVPHWIQTLEISIQVLLLLIYWLSNFLILIAHLSEVFGVRAPGG